MNERQVRMKRAISLMNMDGPSNLDEVEILLSHIFNDRHIIGAPKPIRNIMSKLITWKRKEAKINYAQIGGRSPILGYTKEFISDLVESQLNAIVHMLMCYTPLFASDVLLKLQAYRYEGMKG